MKLSEISNLVGGQIVGDGNTEIYGIASLEEANKGDISFLANRKYLNLINTSKASGFLLPKGEWNFKIPFILCENPYHAFALVLQQFHKQVRIQDQGIHRTAILAKNVELGDRISIGAHVFIEKGVRVGQNTSIFPNCYIGHNTLLGDEVTIYPNVTIQDEITIGNRVIIHSGSVIGSDGFGYSENDGKYHKIPQVGKITIEDDVEIGANCCIDRATLGVTTIRRGVKLDNLVQIAHNVEIGKNSVIAAQTGISGSSKIGKNAKFGGQVGLVGHITIGENVAIGAKAGVTKSHPDNLVLSGYPARLHKEQLKLEAAVVRIPKLISRIRDIENEVKELKKIVTLNEKQET